MYAHSNQPISDPVRPRVRRTALVRGDNGWVSGGGMSMAAKCGVRPACKAPDYRGRRFYHLTVIARISRGLWRCRCDCGNEITEAQYNLLNSRRKSCGCLHREIQKVAVTKHGLRHTKIYKTWRRMRIRCCDPSSANYRYYGGRGIGICDRWRNSVDAFFADMGHPPTKQHTIERIDNSKGYTPKNCRWATTREQNQNKSNLRYLTFRGKTQNLTAWAREIGLSVTGLSDRLKKMPVDQALTRRKRDVRSQISRS